MPSIGKGKMSSQIVLWRCPRCWEEAEVERTGKLNTPKLPDRYQWKWNRYGRVEHKCLSGIWTICIPIIDFPRYLLLPGKMNGRYYNSRQLIRLYQVPRYECLVLPPQVRTPEMIKKLLDMGLIPLGAADGMATELGHVGQLELGLGV